ncbi:MAG: hypothetical protein ABI759_04550 [Candidatus Solibacter sp.]
MGNLWNAVRDAVGLSIQEFTNSNRIEEERVLRADCTSMSRRCIRVTRGAKFVEIFMDEQSHRIQFIQQPNLSATIAQFRPNSDRSGLECFTVGDDGEISLSMDAIAERALSGLLFDPSPKYYPLA